jgi:hypothetical protein
VYLPPGRYELRLAAHNATSGRDGSVFTDAVVPDYSNVPSSASPVVLRAVPGRASAPKDLLSPLLPLVPTFEREFTKTDRVTAFFRLYQSGQKPVAPVQVVIAVRDSQDHIKVSETQTLPPDRFPAAGQEAMPAAVTAVGAPTPPRGLGVTPYRTSISTPTADQFANLSLRTADVKYTVPLSQLLPGPHLLTIEAQLGTTIIRRDVRFTVK